MGQLAINGGNPCRVRPFYPWPFYDDRELQLLEEVIRSRRWFSGMRGADPGTKTELLQDRFAAYHDARYGIACCNGTVAIEIALRAAGVGAGDEVIVPALTFIATLSAVLQVNAIPVVVDTLYENHCIDPAAIEAAITDRTKAVIPVHFGGFSCDMDRIMEIARPRKLCVIEDAAHAHGSVYKGRKIGSLGHMATFSFQESKSMTAGEGGMITTNDPDLAESCIMYRSCGRKEGESWYVHYAMPVNYRLSELQSAVLLAQMERLDDQVRRKNEAMRFLTNDLNQIGGLEAVPGDGKTDVNGLYLFLLRYDPSHFSGTSRDQFVKALNAEGIPSHIGYPWPLTRNPMFQDIPQGAKGCPYSCPYYGKEVNLADTPLPVSERICAETVVIPHQVLLSPDEDLADIGKAVRKIRDNSRELGQRI
jgi:dTDP-4-amino-4,6-dideoxygalactose transaminase